MLHRGMFTIIMEIDDDGVDKGEEYGSLQGPPNVPISCLIQAGCLNF